MAVISMRTKKLQEGIKYIISGIRKDWKWLYRFVLKAWRYFMNGQMSYI
jgi:hypothetical protein